MFVHACNNLVFNILIDIFVLLDKHMNKQFLKSP